MAVKRDKNWPFFRVSQVSLTSEPGDVPETDLLHLC